MIRVAVIDDEPLARSGVLVRLAEHTDIEVVGEYGDGISALEGIIARAPDVVIIDVQMPGMTGLDLLATQPVQTRPLAILLTAYDHFAVRAFALQAVDYLLKPIDDERFAEALDRARHAHAYRGRELPASSSANEQTRLHTNRPVYVTKFQVRLGRRLAFINAADVEWIEADGDYASLHVGARVYLLRESLQRLSVQLDPTHFIRVHRSTIVRIDQLAELQPLSNRDAMLRLRDGTLLRASRTYIDSLLSAMHGQ